MYDALAVQAIREIRALKDELAAKTAEVERLRGEITGIWDACERASSKPASSPELTRLWVRIGAAHGAIQESDLKSSSKNADVLQVTNSCPLWRMRPRPQDPGLHGDGWTFKTCEHGGDEPDTMPQAIEATDAEGRSWVYVPLFSDGQEPAQ